MYELYKFNNIEAPTNNDTFITLFEEQVKKHPNNVALICDNKSLTYLELNKKANSLAHIIKESIKEKNTIIPIISYRSLEVIIGILAILKSGHAYLPIDPDYPEERINYILEDCNPELILTQKILKNNFKNKTIIEID